MCSISGVDCQSWPNLLAAKLLYERAVEVVRTTNRASVAHLQRQMCISYNQAVDLIDELEKRGVIGPKRPGWVTREILNKSKNGRVTVLRDRKSKTTNKEREDSHVSSLSNH